jgi:excisionase family DNA binding protein
LTASTAVHPEQHFTRDAAAQPAHDAVIAAGLRDRLDTYRTAAEYLHCHPGHVRRLVARGDLPHIKFDRAVRIRRSDLLAYVEAHLVPARTGGAA